MTPDRDWAIRQIFDCDIPDVRPRLAGKRQIQHLIEVAVKQKSLPVNGQR